MALTCPCLGFGSAVGWLWAGSSFALGRLWFNCGLVSPALVLAFALLSFGFRVVLIWICLVFALAYLWLRLRLLPETYCFISGFGFDVGSRLRTLVLPLGSWILTLAPGSWL